MVVFVACTCVTYQCIASLDAHHAQVCQLRDQAHAAVRMRLAGWLLVLLAAYTHSTIALDCRSVVSNYYAYNVKEAAPYSRDNLVYFLHVPRTAGRTFFSCLLKQGTPLARRCPRAYDHIRINFTVPNCHLLSSHDDFSVVQKLPANTAVVNQLRHPIDRVLSAYEFAVEVAARQVKRPKKTGRARSRTTTDSVWPWSYLIPFFARQMRERMEALQQQPLDPQGYWAEYKTDDGRPYYYNKVLNVSKWELEEADQPRLLPPVDPYDHPAYMSLREFIDHPVAQELLHNGEALQVLGATNYSHWEQSHELRECLVSDPTAAQEMLDFARKRLQTFVHVGTTDRLHDSFEAAAASLGLVLSGHAYGGGENSAADIEANTRALTWQEAMTRADSPRPPPTPADDLYDDSPAALEDIHQLAGDVRRARNKVSIAKQEWNKAVEAGAPQPQLRKLRTEMLQLEAAVAAAQDVLVAARTDMIKEKRAAAANKEKVLDMALGAEVQRCSARAQKKNSDRRKTSLTNLRLPDGRPVDFSRASRRGIPADIIEDIKRRNSLDMELHALGLQLLEQRRQQYAEAGSLQQLPQVLVQTSSQGSSGSSKPKDEL